MKIEIKKDIHYIRVPALEQMSKVLHAFTTRQDGLGARMNGMKDATDWHPVAEAFGIAYEQLITVDQVHGGTVITIDGTAPPVAELRNIQADGMITDIRGHALGIETADCVPILLYDPGTPAIGAVHAGWKSTAKRVVEKAVQRMGKEYGADPRRMVAAIGPAVGPECYEVDDAVMGPVKEHFTFWREVASPRENGRWSLDLVKTNAMILVESGLSEKNIHSLGICTSCRKDLFYSFRAEGKTGRMLSVIMLKP